MATSSSIEIGAVFQGGFRITAELGSGSFGRVYKAMQLSTGQDVAIKILRTSDHAQESDGMNAERLRREMQLCAKLSHPNIVQLIDGGTSDDGLYAIFDYIPGATLEHVLTTQGKLGMREGIRLMSQVLDALSCAHAAGVVHRDLKPANIMITDTGARRNAMVLDFGLGGFAPGASAWDLPRLTATREMLGTPCYAAPEQLRGEPPSPRSDLYAWGLIFLECLTGERVFNGESGMEVIRKQLDPEPVALPSWLHGQPLGDLLQTVTAKDPDGRTLTAHAILRELDAFAGEPPSMPAASGSSELPEGERRQLTVVSCRVVVGPSGSANLDIEEADRVLHAQHAVLADLAHRFGGQVANVQAERVLMVFGYPQAREDDVRRAVLMAMRFVAQAGERSGGRGAGHGLQLKIGIGIHTGLVIARGERRATRQRLQDLVGPTPQAADDLAQLAGPSEILVSEDTGRLRRGAIACERIGEHVLAGGSRPVTIFRICDRKADAGIASLADGESPLVGRDHQLRQIIDHWDEVCAGRSGAIVIRGEAGIGKTRLVRELRRRVPADGWCEMRCFAETMHTPLAPVIDMLGGLIGDQTVEAFLANHGLALSRTVSLVESLLGRRAPQDDVDPPLTPDRERELTLAALVALYTAMARQRPLALTVEDMHWADPTTLDLMSALVHEANVQTSALGDATQLLLVLTARPEFNPTAETSVIMLSRLTDADVTRLVTTGLAKEVDLPSTLVQQIIERTEGVPLFVEEVTRVLLEAHAATGAGATADDVTAFEIPSLRELFISRLDALSPRTRQTAQLAAVLGREFDYAHVRAIAAGYPALGRVPDDELQELVRTGMVHRQRRAPTERYVFKHVLLRDATYESLTRPARLRLHAQVAEVLRQSFPEVERDRPEMLAQHFEAGGQPDLAIDYWNRGGDRAMRRGAYVEAIRHLQHGLRLLETLPDPTQRARREIGLTESVGIAKLATEGYASTGVEQQFRRALELCEELGGDVPLRTLYGIWAVHITRSDLEATTTLLPRLRGLAERTKDPVALHTASCGAGIYQFQRGNFVQAREDLTRSMQWYDTDAWRAFVNSYGYDGRLYSHGYLTWNLHLLGCPDQAVQYRDEMLALAEATRQPYVIALALSFAAALAHERREPEAARALADRAIALASEEKLYFWLGIATCLRGWADVDTGRCDEGADRIRSGLGILQSIGIRAIYGYYLSFLAEAHLVRGASAEGLAVVDEALAMSQTLLDRFYEPELLRLKGELLRCGGDSTGAERLFHSARELAQQRSAKLFELRAIVSLGRLPTKRADAAALAAPLLAGFSEGRDLRDLHDAIALADR